MSLLSRLLECDFHRSNLSSEARPLIIGTPARESFVPAVVSTTEYGKFIVSRKLTRENNIQSGVFSHNPDQIDELIVPLLLAAYGVSVEENYSNRFTTATAAFKYIDECSGTGAHPHILLIPSDWDNRKVEKLLGKKNLAESNGNVYRKICRVVSYDVKFPTFFSRPDFVGMYTQFSGDFASIILHNIKQGLAFVVPK